MRGNPGQYCGWLRSLIVAASLAGTVQFSCAAEPPSGTGSHSDLLALFEDFEAWKQPDPGSGAFERDALRQKRSELEVLQERLHDMNVRAWPTEQQVDYLVVRAELDQQQFVFDVTQPWFRDPVFYIAGLLETAFVELPLANEDSARLRQQLAAVPDVLAAARQNLRNVPADYANLAIRSLTQSDGVENGYPYRANPPDGIIGWYEDLLERASSQPELQPDITAALSALRDFNSWLIEHLNDMTADNGVGQKLLDWFVRHALLLPYTSAEMAILVEREYDRLWGFYALERHRNRDLPEIRLSGSREEYQQRIADTDTLIRRFLSDESFISIPDFIPGDWREMGYNVPWIVRNTPPNFWEQVQFRDPAPDHLHAVIPGHRYDAMMAANIAHPVRSRVNFGSRWQGWAVYLEEAALQAGALEERPRTRELIYVFGIWRAARALGDIRNQWNELTAAETADYWLTATPLLDPDVARKYAYLRPLPGHGLEYTIGNFEMWRLLSTRKQQLGEAFDLKAFHDDFIARGRIPISLIRYEMTGLDDEVKHFWDRPPLSTILSESR